MSEGREPIRDSGGRIGGGAMLHSWGTVMYIQVSSRTQSPQQILGHQREPMTLPVHTATGPGCLGH